MLHQMGSPYAFAVPIHPPLIGVSCTAVCRPSPFGRLPLANMPHRLIVPRVITSANPSNHAPFRAMSLGPCRWCMLAYFFARSKPAIRLEPRLAHACCRPARYRHPHHPHALAGCQPRVRQATRSALRACYPHARLISFPVISTNIRQLRGSYHQSSTHRWAQRSSHAVLGIRRIRPGPLACCPGSSVG